VAIEGPSLDQEAVSFRLAKQVYKEIRGDPNWRELVVEHELIAKRLLNEHFASRWSRRIFGAAFVTVVILLSLGVNVQGGTGEAGTIGERVERAYLISRLKKEKGSAPDLARVTARLMSRLSSVGDSAQRKFWLEALREPLRDPTLSMPRVDATIQVLLAARDHDRIRLESIAGDLLYALRNSNVDARRRIQAALVYLAHGLHPMPSKDLLDWNPTEGDSVPQIEQRIDQWRAAWASPKT
jgi:hypothetical protein